MSISPAPAATVRRRRLTVVAGVAGAIVIGILTATQSRINSELARGLDDGYLGSVISFGSGFVILLVALAVWRPGRRGLARVASAVRARTTPWWYVTGGAAGGLFVLSQGLTGATLGVALFTVAVVCGQTISGLAIDRRGIGATPPAAITVTRLVGSALALVAVGWAVSAQLVSDIPAWMLVLPFAAGLGVGGQQAVNGQVRIIAGSAMTATFLNFLAGTTVLLAAFAVHEALVGWPHRFPTNPWLYTGGLIGTLFIAGAVIVVRTTGVLLLGLGSIAGQLVMSLTLDAFLPIRGHVIEASTVGGTLLTLVAVAIAAVPSRRLRARSGTPRG